MFGLYCVFHWTSDHSLASEGHALHFDDILWIHEANENDAINNTRFVSNVIGIPGVE